MKFPIRAILSLTIAGSSIAAPTIQAATSVQQPTCVYPIGTQGNFAKTAGNLFDIDGKVEYFAGTMTLLHGRN